MPIERDSLVIVDIESTCWKNQKAPEGQISEIIEIGLCTLELASSKIDKKRGIFVRPIESSISPFCTELTTITPQMIAQDSIAFETACQILQDDYSSKKHLWLSWGNYDRRMFTEQNRVSV